MTAWKSYLLQTHKEIVVLNLADDRHTASRLILDLDFHRLCFTCSAGRPLTMARRLHESQERLTATIAFFRP